MAKQKPPAVDPRDLLRNRPRRTVPVSICMGYDEADALETARKAHAEAEKVHTSALEAVDRHEARTADIDPDDPADFTRRVTADKTAATLAEKVDEAVEALAVAAAALAKAEKAAEAVTIEFRLQAIGRPLTEQLRTEHRPTAEQKTEYAKLAAEAGASKVQQIGPDWNVDTYPPAFIAAALLKPDFTADEVDELIWSNPSITKYERERLFHAAVNAQNATNTVS